MCAIGGIYVRPGKTISLRNNLEAMTRLQHHRGPDASGVWLAESHSIGLSHNRLAILDLTEDGNQPMHSSDQRYTVVFNGEIYNYRELQQQLIACGSQFRTQSDTEVLLEAYRHWGQDMLARLRGMFAFVLYDHSEDSLLCARDRVGKKPFVFAQTPQAFIFASEIPAVRQVDGVDTTHDHDAIASMLLHNLRHIPDPYTAYKGIKRLRAGHAMLIRQGMIEKAWRYWTPTPTARPTTPKELRAILEESIELRMRADVPVGAFLSGGIDSSAIVAIMQQYASKPIHTYALGFDQDDEDLRRARQVAHQLGTRHKEFYFDPDEQWQIFNKLISTYGDPIMLLPLVHAYMLSSAIRDDGIKVVLTGNGADEIFYGYTGHTRTLRISKWLDRLAPIRPLIRPLKQSRLGWMAEKPGVRKAAYYSAIARSSWRHCLSEDATIRLSNRAAEEMRYWGESCPSQHYIDESNFVGLLVENPHSVTIAGDLPAMAASIEIRAPFLDQQLIAFALATPVELKIPDIKNKNRLKAILRDAVGDLIPDEILKAPKRGFGAGIQEDTLLRGPWRERTNDCLEGLDTIDGLLDKNKILQQWQSFLNKKEVSANQIAKQLAIQCWMRNFK